MLKVSDCRPGVLVECIAPDDEIYVGEIYTIRALHEPPYRARDGRLVQAHSISLREVADNPDARGAIDVFRLELFRLVSRDHVEAARHVGRVMEAQS